MPTKKVLIVEDDPEQLEIYKDMLAKLDYAVLEAYSVEGATQVLQDNAIDLTITDIHLTNSATRDSFEGFEIIKYAKANNPECMIIVMSNDPKVTTYKKALELGALNFIKKPVCSIEEFRLAILTARERKDYEKIKRKIDSYGLPKDIEAKCQDGLVLNTGIRENVEILAMARELPCIIYGETGTGKEEIAKLILKRRIEKEGPVAFIAVNCANLDANTAASQLFGHKRGSFTGAERTTTGFVGEANGGILFLDEIHTLSIDCQRRLLRVLNDGTYERFGDTKTLFSSFQVIVASGKNLDELVKIGTFIPDLRSRITGIIIELDPLRKRLDDMDILIPLIFAKLNAKIWAGELDKIIERCKAFYWQDNIRLLVNALKATSIICQCKNKPIAASDLQVYPSMLSPDASFKGESSNLYNEEELKMIFDPLNIDMNLTESIDRYESMILTNSLKRHRKIGTIIEKLGISLSTFDAKRKKYDLFVE